MGLLAVNNAAVTKISVARDFATSPGFRYPSDGPFSGEEFRKNILDKNFTEQPDAIIEVDLDGTEGYATSFLEEAFGGLARDHGASAVTRRLQYISYEDPTLITEIMGYIRKVELDEN